MEWVNPSGFGVHQDVSSRKVIYHRCTKNISSSPLHLRGRTRGFPLELHRDTWSLLPVLMGCVSLKCILFHLKYTIFLEALLKYTTRRTSLVFVDTLNMRKAEALAGTTFAATPPSICPMFIVVGPRTSDTGHSYKREKSMSYFGIPTPPDTLLHLCKSWRSRHPTPVV